MSEILITRSPTRRALLVGGASVLALGACSGNIIGPNDPSAIFVLAPDLHDLPKLEKVSWQLAIARPTTSQSLNTQRIALTRGVNMDYFANAEWTDTAPQLLQSLLLEAFEKSHAIPAVATDLEGVHAEYILETELRDFEARYDASDAPPSCVIGVTVKLVKTLGRDVVAMQEIRKETTAKANTVQDVVAAFDVSMSAILADIVEWTVSTGRSPSGSSASL